MKKIKKLSTPITQGHHYLNFNFQDCELKILYKEYPNSMQLKVSLRLRKFVNGLSNLTLNFHTVQEQFVMG